MKQFFNHKIYLLTNSQVFKDKIRARNYKIHLHITVRRYQSRSLHKTSFNHKFNNNKCNQPFMTYIAPLFITMHIVFKQIHSALLTN